MDLLEIIRQRKSSRAFSDRIVGEYEMNKLFEAARWASSSYNGQPWRYIYADKASNPELFEKVLGLLVEFNQAWAKAAPVLVLTMARKKFEGTGEPNRHACHDLGLSIGNIYAMGASMGLVVHEMGGFSVEKAKKELNIPEFLEPISVMAIGYPGDPGKLPLDMYKMENKTRERKNIEEFVFKSAFEKKEDNNNDAK